PGPDRTGGGGSLGSGGPAHRGAGRRPGPSGPEEPRPGDPVRRGPRGLPGPAGLAGDRARHNVHSSPSPSPPTFSPTATSSFPSGALTGETRPRDATTCSIFLTIS